MILKGNRGNWSNGRLDKKYRMLGDTDQINLKSLDKLKCEQFRRVIKIILNDYRRLLSLGEDKFWAQVEADVTTYSLRQSIQSCLSCFPRHGYAECVTRQRRINLPSDDSFKYWELLIKALLVVLLRLSEARKPRHRSFVFQHWYLDTVKILDAAAVYGEVYPEAVKRLVRNMVKIEPQLYLLDYSTNIIGLIVRSAKDLCKATYRYGVNLLEPDTAPCIYSHFDSPKKCHCTTLVKTCFSVYDLLLNINAIYTYFPFRMQIELLATSVLYKYLMLLYNQLVIDEREYWVLGQEKDQFILIIGLLFKTFVKTFKHTLALLVQILTVNKFKVEMYPLKQTYFNLAHFLLREAVVAYEDKDDKIVCQKHLQCSQDLFRNVMIMSRKDIVYFGEGTLSCFNIKHYNYRSLQWAKEFQLRFRKEMEGKEKIMKIQKYLTVGRSQLRSLERTLPKQVAKNAKSHRQVVLRCRYYKQYDDSPEQDEEKEEQTITTKQIQQSCTLEGINEPLGNLMLDLSGISYESESECTESLDVIVDLIHTCGET